MSRIDPFFRTRAPHRSSYLESLHRQWTPPERDDLAFQKALTFREREKAKYRAMDTENAKLKAELTQIRTQHTGAMARVREIEALFDKLSKQPRNAPTPVDARSAEPSGARDDEAATLDEPTDVPGQVLHADVGGSAAQHTAEGSEQRSGSGDDAGDESEGAVRDGDQ